MDVRVREKRAKDDAMWAEYHGKRRRCGGCNNDFLKTQFQPEATVCPGCQDAGVVSLNTWKARRNPKTSSYEPQSSSVTDDLINGPKADPNAENKAANLRKDD